MWERLTARFSLDTNCEDKQKCWDNNWDVKQQNEFMFKLYIKYFINGHVGFQLQEEMGKIETLDR